jgi:RNA polymerase sigma-70 factor (ECF subfamily)
LLKAGEVRGLELLFREHYGELCGVVDKIVRDPAQAEDLVQDLFLTVWQRRSTWEAVQSFRAYLRRAAVNRALNHVRSRRRDRHTAAESAAKDAVEPQVLAELDRRDLGVEVDRAVDRLPERCRLVFVLSRFEEMSYAEIADAMDISVKTVEHQLGKALRLLREALQDYREGRSR